MGMREFDVKVTFNEGNIKTLTVITDNDIVFLDVINEIVKVLPMNIGLNTSSSEVELFPR